MMKKNHHNKGFGLAEIVVGSALISLVLFGLSFAFQASLRLSRETGQRIQAQFLAEEGLEAARIIRDQSWAGIGVLSTTTIYYLDFAGGSWGATTSSSMIEGMFERRLLVEDVFRDANDDIASSGTYDPNIKKIRVVVSWAVGQASSTSEVATYLTNIFDN